MKNFLSLPLRCLFLAMLSGSLKPAPALGEVIERRHALFSDRQPGLHDSSFASLTTFPIAIPDSIAVTGRPVPVDVLKNDLNQTGSGLEIQSFTQGAHGSVALSKSASELVYTPAVNTSDAIPADDSFTYTLAGGSSATVSVVNNSSAVADAIYMGKSKFLLNPTENDIDRGAGVPAIVAVGKAKYGRVTLTDGVIAYNPTEFPLRTDHVSYTLADGSSAVVTFSKEPVPLQQVVEWGAPFSSNVTLPPGSTQVIQAAQGDNFSVALKKNGTVMAWGTNEHGETSVPAGLDRVIAIAAGAQHTLALKGDGTVVAWGSNIMGASTVPTGLSGVKTVSAGFNSSFALKNDGSVVAWGANANVPSELTGVIAIASELCPGAQKRRHVDHLGFRRTACDSRRFERRARDCSRRSSCAGAQKRWHRRGMGQWVRQSPAGFERSHRDCRGPSSCARFEKHWHPQQVRL